MMVSRDGFSTVYSALFSRCLHKFFLGFLAGLFLKVLRVPQGIYLILPFGITSRFISRDVPLCLRISFGVTLMTSFFNSCTRSFSKDFELDSFRYFYGNSLQGILMVIL